MGALLFRHREPAIVAFWCSAVSTCTGLLAISPLWLENPRRVSAASTIDEDAIQGNTTILLSQVDLLALFGRNHFHPLEVASKGMLAVALSPAFQ